MWEWKFRNRKTKAAAKSTGDEDFVERCSKRRTLKCPHFTDILLSLVHSKAVNQFRFLTIKLLKFDQPQITVDVGVIMKIHQIDISYAQIDPMSQAAFFPSITWSNHKTIIYGFSVTVNTGFSALLLLVTTIKEGGGEYACTFSLQFLPAHYPWHHLKIKAHVQ